MKNKIKFILLILLIFSLQTCKKDTSPCGGRKSYYNLTEAEKAKVPYTGNDTLVFVSNTNDTAVCIGQGKKQGYDVELIGVNSGDCKPDENWWEKYTYSFKSGELNFELKLYNYLDNLVVSYSNWELGTTVSYLDDKYYSNYLINGINRRGLLFYQDSSFTNTVLYTHTIGIIQIKSQNNTWSLIK